MPSWRLSRYRVCPFLEYIMALTCAICTNATVLHGGRAVTCSDWVSDAFSSLHTVIANIRSLQQNSRAIVHYRQDRVQIVLLDV